jgi:hypothetical protein
MFKFECGKHFGCGKQIVEAHIVGMGEDDALMLLLSVHIEPKVQIPTHK